MIMGKAEDLKKEKLMKTWKEVLQLNIRAFFEYVRGISYGYRDAEGKIHHLEVSEDYRKERGNSVYAFSSPEQVVAQNCAWCWDVAELIRCWCEFHALPCKSVFMEYLSPELHQTHVQVFVRFEGRWYEAPDNTSPVPFGSRGFERAEDCIADFVSAFTAYLKGTLKQAYDEKKLTVKEFHCRIPAGISDEVYLELLRGSD